MSDIRSGPDDGETRPPLPDCAGCTLLAEANHSTANHLGVLLSYIRLRAASLATTPQPTAADLGLFVRGLEAQILAIARLHRLLTSPKTRSAVDLSTLLPDVCAAFATMTDSEISIVQDLRPGCVVGADQCLPISQIVAEAIMNAVKYARPSRGPTIILVRCQATGGGAQVVVTDNGMGLPETLASAATGHGIRLMRAHAQAMRAEIAFESSCGGLTVRISLPRSKTSSG